MTRRTTPPEVVHFIHEKTALGYFPTEIRRMLAREGTEVPSLRTTQYIAREVRPADDSDTWSPATAEAAEAALVMPVLVTLVRAGQMTSITQAMARWVARVRLIAPELDALDALLFAGRYLAAERSGGEYADVDLAIARRLARRRPPRVGRASRTADDDA
jgi:hypothetical protein